MTVICEECGKVYHVDPDKLDRYKGKNVRVRCRECGHATQISRLMDAAEEPAYDFEEAAVLSMPSSTPPQRELPEEPAPRQDIAYRTSGTKGRAGWLGLRGKMVILFLVIPILLLAISGYLSQQLLRQMATDITDESTELVLQEGREKLMQKARDVAKQCEIYLRNHPNLEREDFAYDPEFSMIAVQVVGETGYTCLLQQPEPERGQNWTTWAHPNPNIIGIDDLDMIRKALGPHSEEFLNILASSEGMVEAEGSYMWKDPDGKMREKYMAIAPINLEGLPFLVPTTAYIDEFTAKTDFLKDYARDKTAEIRNINVGVLLIVIIIIGLCILIYGYRLTRSIQHLTDAADRISVGDLEAEIDIKSKDELGNLADAISRMQDSLRFSIERLRRRR